MKSGSIFPMTSTTAARAPSFTPTTLIQVRMTSGTVITAMRPQPYPAGAHRYATVRARPLESDATEAMRASHVIHPTSNMPSVLA